MAWLGGSYFDFHLSGLSCVYINICHEVITLCNVLVVAQSLTL